MTLVIETQPGVHPATDPQLRAALTGLGIPPDSGRHEELGGHHFYYYALPAVFHTASISTALGRLPGIAAAFVKPDGAPPQ